MNIPPRIDLKHCINSIKVKHVTEDMNNRRITVNLGRDPNSWISIGDYNNQMPASDKIIGTGYVDTSTIQIQSTGRGVGEDSE
jgi:hypothetical protein